MLSEQVRQIAQAIGQFYLGKFGGNYDQANQHIEQLRISQIDYTPGRIAITTARPGLLIGRIGEDIIELGKYLNEHGYPDTKPYVIEDEDYLGDWLCVEEPDEDWPDESDF